MGPPALSDLRGLFFGALETNKHTKMPTLFLLGGPPSPGTGTGECSVYYRVMSHKQTKQKMPTNSFFFIAHFFDVSRFATT